MPIPSQQLTHFTNRNEELKYVQRFLDTPADNQLPVVMFFGIGGTGKSLLLHKLRDETLRDETTKVPCAHLDFDPVKGGRQFQTDYVAALAALRRQFAPIECPTFDLAYAWLRLKQGNHDDSMLEGNGFAASAWEFVKVGTETITNIPGVSLLAWFAEKLTIPVWEKVEQTKLFEWLATTLGKADYIALRRMPTWQDIYPLLLGRLRQDLAEQLPKREGRACRGVLLFDTFEAIRQGIHGRAESHNEEDWVRDLWSPKSPLLILIFGKDELQWSSLDSNWGSEDRLCQRRIDGLSEPDARQYLASRGIADKQSQDAILRVTRIDRPFQKQKANGVTHHLAYSLGLCADSALQCGGKINPQMFDMAPGDVDELHRRFFKCIDSAAIEYWVKLLALTPRFDEHAARVTFSPESRALENASAWERLCGYSFLWDTADEGWWTVHSSMRENVSRIVRRSADQGREKHEVWLDHWHSRSKDSTDIFASLAWYHRYCIEPQTAYKEWRLAAQAAWQHGKMKTHYGLLGWWDPVGIEEAEALDNLSADGLVGIADEYSNATLGNISANLHQAIKYYKTALSYYSEAHYQEERAKTQNNLGLAYSKLPTKNREENLAKAIACFEAALRIRTEEKYPYDWAMTLVNRGNAYWLKNSYHEMSVEDDDKNLADVIHSYQSALKVLTKDDYPQDWATTQSYLGNAYLQLSDNNVENVAEAIKCYKAARSVAEEANSQRALASEQNNLGLAYVKLITLGSKFSDENRRNNLKEAIEYLKDALQVRTEANFPYDWAMTQQNLGNAYWEMPILDRPGSIEEAIGHYESALRVLTEADFPLEWAMTKIYLANAYLELPDNTAENLTKAMDCYNSVSNIVTEAEYPKNWAMVQNNLGRAYGFLSTANRLENLHNAVGCFKNALRVRIKRDYLPIQDCAFTQMNLGNVYLELAGIESKLRLQNLRAAQSCFKTAARVFEKVGDLTTAGSLYDRCKEVQIQLDRQQET